MPQNAKVPYAKGLDNTLTMLQEGYLFIKNNVDKYQSDIFETRLLGQKVVCMSGKEAAQIFYDPERFYRNGALPKRIQKSLTGENALQTMDGEAHIHRKLLFLSLMNSTQEKRLAGLAMDNWQGSAYKWESSREVVLFDEAKYILCKTACRWAGVPLS